MGLVAMLLPRVQMRLLQCSLVGLGLATAALLAAQQPVGEMPPAATVKIKFAKHIYPILSAHCFDCHRGLSASSGVRLDLREELLGQTNGKPVVKLGDSAASKLIHAVSGKIPGKLMPRKGKALSAEQIGLLRAWIDQGLDWDETLLPSKAVASHWSFQPIGEPKLPKVKNARWVSNPIDAFIAARHEAKGLTPAPRATPHVLVRRLYLDLTGLPPTPNQVEAFVKDDSPDAYARLVDQLLQSPHYGERWGRHWLDVARWAESEGYESNHVRPYAWRYRDYVVQSFNADLPLPTFIQQQIAGDEMTPYADENLIATGFLAASRLSSNEEDRWRQKNDILVDIVNATSGAFLGLTMSCAQCHNHKFDPITARDYYRFQGFFIKGQPANLALKNAKFNADYAARKPAEFDAVYQLKHHLFEEGRKRKIEAATKKLSPQHLQALATPADQRTDEEEKLVRSADLDFQFTAGQIEAAIPTEDRKLYDELKKKLTALKKGMIDRPQTFGFYSAVTSPHAIEVLPMKGFYPPPYVPEELKLAFPHVLVGGDVHHRKFKVNVGWPEILGATPNEAVAKQPRLALAKWLGSAQNPLTARVYVNRIWHHHFGRGLVATPGDFGLKGAPPTHPEMLDWLAREFIKSGWSTKHLHRLIVTSETYRQSSKRQSTNTKIDPDNEFLSCWKPRRLEAEAIRDAILAASGELDRALGGPSEADHAKSLRRTLYLLQKRDHPTPAAHLFDGPNAALESCHVRNVSTVPLQALYLLNNDFCVQRGQALAKIIVQSAGANQGKQIDTAFLHVLGRLPDAHERQLAKQFLAQHSGENSLAQLCQALMNVNEFVYLE